MKPNKICFSIHSFEEVMGNLPSKGIQNYICFCPLWYWKRNKCFPDYVFADKMKKDIPLPKGYWWYSFMEGTNWVSKKSKDEIIVELTSLGFSYNKKMEDMYFGCF